MNENKHATESRPGCHDPDLRLEANWQLREGEMSSDEIRGLGYVLYTMLFERPSKSILSAVSAEHTPDTTDPILSRPGVISAEYFVEKYAEMNRLNTSVLKRWVQAASIEIAQATLPLLYEEHNRLTHASTWSPDEITTYTMGVLNPVERVSQMGLQASTEDHSLLVGEAFNIDRNTEGQT